MNGIGAHEVIVETPDHDADLRASAASARSRACSRRTAIACSTSSATAASATCMIFKNHGVARRRHARAHALAADRAAGRAQERARGDGGRARVLPATRSAASSATSCARSCASARAWSYENARLRRHRALRAQVPVRDLGPAARATASAFEDCAARRVRRARQCACGWRCASCTSRSTTRRTTSSCTPRRSTSSETPALPLAHRDHADAHARSPASSGARASTSTRRRPRRPRSSCARSGRLMTRPARRLRGRALRQDRRARRRARRAAARAGASSASRSRWCTPRYRSIDPEQLRPGALAAHGARCRSAPAASTSACTRARRRAARSVRLYLVDHPPSFDRDGLYGDAGRRLSATTRGASPSSAARRSRWLRSSSALARHRARPRLAGGPGPPLRARRDRRSARRPRRVFTIHNLAYQGLFPGERRRRAGPAARALSSRRLRVLRAGQLPQGRPGAGRRDHDREPALRARDPDARAGRGLDGLLARARRSARRDPQRRRLRRVEPGARSAPRGQLLARRAARASARCKAALQRELGLPVRAETPLCGIDLAARRPEGLRPAARGAAAAARTATLQMRRARHRAIPPSSARSASSQRSTRRSSRCASPTTRRSPIASRPAATCSSCRRASSRAGSTSCTRCATARRRSCAPPAGSTTPSSTTSRARARGTGFKFERLHHRGAARRLAPRAHRLPRDARRVPGAAPPRHGAGLLLGSATSARALPSAR